MRTRLMFVAASVFVVAGALIAADDKPDLKLEALLVQINEAGTNRVEISIGADDGLRTGHSLRVWQKKQAVAILKVAEVSPDRCVATIEELSKDKRLKRGDRVTYGVDPR